MGEVLERADNTLFRVTELEGQETATIEFTDIHQELHNIHISLSVENASTAADKAVNIQLKLKDATSDYLFSDSGKRYCIRSAKKRIHKAAFMR